MQESVRFSSHPEQPTAQKNAQEAELQRLKNVDGTPNKFTYCEKSPHTVETAPSWHKMKDYGKRQITEDAPSPQHLGYRQKILSPPNAARTRQK